MYIAANVAITGTETFRATVQVAEAAVNAMIKGTEYLKTEQAQML